MNPRSSEFSRETSETRIEARLNLDGQGQAQVSTGIAFLDHMLSALAKHSGIDLELECTGDLEVDDHHSAEDCALVLGELFDRALGDRRGIRRFGCAYAPLDEALVRVVVDFSGRPWPEVHLGFTRERLGAIATENLTHFFNSFAMAARLSLHADLIRGSNDHHKSEAAFKALALALREALGRNESAAIPSTKGVLS